MSVFSRRNRKKAAYATGLFVVIFTIIGFIFSDSLIPAPVAVVTPQPSSVFTPIIQEQAVALPYSLPGGKTGIDVVVQLRNQNARAGLTDYPVGIVVMSPSGEQLLSHTETTYILPGSLQYVVALGLELEAGQSFGSLTITLPRNPSFQELPDGAELPTFNTFLRERSTRQIGTQVIESQTGLVRNTSTFNWQRVEVVVVGLDSSRSIVAAGKTVMGALAANEQREFTVQWPKPEAELSQVIALPNTDILREDNFLQVIGNPESLR